MNDAAMPRPMKTLFACLLASWHTGLLYLPLEGNHPASPSEYPERNQHTGCKACIEGRRRSQVNIESTGDILFITLC